MNNTGLTRGQRTLLFLTEGLDDPALVLVICREVGHHAVEEVVQLKQRNNASTSNQFYMLTKWEANS